MTLSPHVIVDNCPDELLDRCLLYFKRVKQLKFVNIGAGAQIDRGKQFVERVHREVPNLRIVWRNLDPEDTGILARPDYTPEKLYAEKVTEHLKWFQDNKVIFMPDNETSGDDNRIKLYARDEAKIATLLHADGLNGAFLRFATGNIQDGSQAGQPSQYPLLKPVFDVMNAGDLVSPNEYRNKPGASSGGHLYRYRLIWQAAGRELPTFIGEAGISVDYDPGKGYQLLEMSDAAVCQLMLDDDFWYEGGEIDRSWYLVGGYTHESFRWRLGIFDYLENHYEKQPPIITPPSPPPVDPPPPIIIPPPPVETPPPFDQQVMKLLYNHLLNAAGRTRQMSLELATISDDLLKDAELLDALIKSQKSNS